MININGMQLKVAFNIWIIKCKPCIYVIKNRVIQFLSKIFTLQGIQKINVMDKLIFPWSTFGIKYSEARNQQENYNPRDTLMVEVHVKSLMSNQIPTWRTWYLTDSWSAIPWRFNNALVVNRSRNLIFPTCPSFQED